MSRPNDGISTDRYRSTMRRFPAGVIVVTLRGVEGPVGFTATSFASLSLEPPLISFNVANTSSSIDAIATTDTLMVHFLGEHQHQLARRFSRSAQRRFTDGELWTTLDTGEPVLRDTPVRLRCLVERRIVVGDHTLVIGLVTDAVTDRDNPETPSERPPLLYHDGSYHSLRSVHNSSARGS